MTSWFYAASVKSTTTRRRKPHSSLESNTKCGSAVPDMHSDGLTLHLFPSPRTACLLALRCLEPRAVPLGLSSLHTLSFLILCHFIY